MKTYIKSMKTFETMAVYDVTDYRIVYSLSEDGYIKIFSPEAVQISTAYIGMWCVFDNEVFYISNASPEDAILTLTIQMPYKAFSKQLYKSFTTGKMYGYAINSTMMTHFIMATNLSGGSDAEYKMPYFGAYRLQGEKYYDIKTDDYGCYYFKDIIKDAWDDDIDFDVRLANKGNSLQYGILNRDTTPQTILFDDGHNRLESEVYEASFLAKVSVVQKQEDNSLVFKEYYYGADRHIYEAPPTPRVQGRWETYTCDAAESPLSVATGAFSHNINSHKIEFYTDMPLFLGQYLKIRLRDEVFDTKITSVTKSSDDDRLYIVCGNLAVTLTDKLNKLKG